MQRIEGRFQPHGWRACLTLALLVTPGIADQTSNQVNLSLSAYRELGQPDLRQNGVNIVDATGLSSPQGVAVDREGHLYVADTSNHRVEAWTSAAGFQTGEAAALTLGQPTAQNSNQLGIGVKGLSFPASVALDPVTGNLYVADFGNSRVLRFPKPFANPSRVEPDAVYGQPDFNTRTPNSSGITERTMYFPRGVAVDGDGNLWVADSGNHRLLRFPVALLNNPNPAADLVLGQPDFHSGSVNGGKDVSASGFNTPMEVAFDSHNNLYVADFLNRRVLQFSAPLTSASTATLVYGQAKFTIVGVPPSPTTSSMAGPQGVAVDGAGSVYVAVPNDNRVLVFAPGAASGDPAKTVLGQPDFSTVTANTGAFPNASAASLSGVAAVALDAQGDILLADSGNNRVLSIPPASKTATRVLGQATFSGNGPNQIKAGSINAAYKIAIDYSHAPFALYVSDTNNHRVLVWKDAAHFRSGDPANLVIGQPTLATAVPNIDSGGTSTPSGTSLAAPRGLAVASDGTLYVADSGNNRVLRYRRPVDQSGRITPDAVLGQSNFTSSASAGLNAASMHSPAGVALGPNGNIFVADSANNRVLEFAAGAPSGDSAIRVYGQPGFTTVAPPSQISAQTLFNPQGLAVDAAYNLYAVDTASNRVLVYPNTNTAPPFGLPASIVIGQDAFDAAAPGSGAARLNLPADVSLDANGNILVSDSGSSRVLAFPSRLYLSTTGAAAYLVVGQPNLGATGANWNSSGGLATPEGLSGPLGVFVDRVGTLYVGDAGNNRVVHFLKGAAVVNGARWDVGVPVGRGSWSVLGGTGFSSDKKLAASATLPTTLVEREVVINDEMKAPLYYFSPQQVNFVFPSNAPAGLQRIAVRVAGTGELIAGGIVSVADYSPAFFTHDQNGQGQAAAINQDGSLNGPNHPAPRGSIVQLFGTGQGPVSSPVADGHPAPLAPVNTVAAPTSDGVACLAGKKPLVCVALGGSGGGAQFAEIQYSGLAPGLIGVWQLNIKIPADGLLGDTIIVHAVIGGAAYNSNLVTLAVK